MNNDTLVGSLMHSRGFCLLIRVFIYQNVHLDKYISKMVVANFFEYIEGQGQRSVIQQDRVQVKSGYFCHNERIFPFNRLSIRNLLVIIHLNL